MHIQSLWSDSVAGGRAQLNGRWPSVQQPRGLGTGKCRVHKPDSYQATCGASLTGPSVGVSTCAPPAPAQRHVCGKGAEDALIERLGKTETTTKGGGGSSAQCGRLAVRYPWRNKQLLDTVVCIVEQLEPCRESGLYIMAAP